MNFSMSWMMIWPNKYAAIVSCLLAATLPPLCSFQVSLQGISGVAQVLLAHHAHERDEDLEHPFWRHLQLVIDARAIPIGGKDKPVSASKHLEARNYADLPVGPELLELLQYLAEALDLQLELSPLPG